MTMNASNDQAVPRHTTAILAIILVSYFMILLDNSIIFTALPIIRTAMHYSTTGLALVQDAYTLVFGGLLLLGARAGDLLGRQRGIAPSRQWRRPPPRTRRRPLRLGGGFCQYPERQSLPERGGIRLPEV
jgi:hypothetical protein